MVNEQGRDEPFTISTSSGPSQQSAPIVVNSTTFTLIRDSGEGVLPLIFTLSIDPVSIGLNGTVVNCTDPRNMLISASTTIQIIDTSQLQSELDNHILTNLSKTKSGTKSPKKRDFWSKIGTFLKIL